MIPSCLIKRRVAILQQKGFTLVELIVTLVLVGIIGTFTTLFMYTGINGYLRVKDTAAGALKAQIALDRISLELRDINEIEAFTPKSNPSSSTDSNIDYFSATLPGDRQIIYNDNNKSISIDFDGNVNTLLDKISSFTMTATYADLNLYPDGNNEVKAIDITFTIEEVGRQFSARIFPRNMVAEP